MALVLDDKIEEQIINQPDTWLILEPHPEFKEYWEVNCIDQAFFFDFEDIIGPYRAVSPKNYAEFKQAADDFHYCIVFTEDPSEVFARYERRLDTPDVVINSHFPNTVNGMLPHQVEGFNLLKDQKASMALWGTGTGKTVLAAALIKHKVVDGDFDLAIMPVRRHNKVSAQRKLLKLAGVESVIIDHDKLDKRIDEYTQMYEGLLAGKPTTLITNYEKFLWDEPAMKTLVEDRNVLILWDEMSVKLGNRGTQLYRAVARVLYKSAEHSDPAKEKKSFSLKWDERRPNKLMQVKMTANPLRRDPDNVLNTTRLLDPDIFPSIKGFNTEYVQSWNYFNPSKAEKYKNLDHLGHKLDHMVHYVDKKDPEIAKYFPTAIEEIFPIEWNDRYLYDTLQIMIEEELDPDEPQANILSMILVMQMVCDAPSMISTSANDRAEAEALIDSFMGGADSSMPKLRGSEIALRLIEALGKDRAFDDQKHSKVQTLRQHLTEDYPNDKFLVYSTFNRLFLPTASQWLSDWGVSHVTYTGTDKHKQEELDAFKADDSIQVFLSSDSGADSLDLEEASVVVHYDLPWEYLLFSQRQNRTSRVTSTHSTVRWLTYVMESSIEDRKVEKIVEKLGYEEAIFGKGDFTGTNKLTKEDYKHILTGKWEG